MATLNNVNGLVIAQEVFEAFKAGLAPLSGFSTDFGPEAAQKMETLRVPVATAINAADYNASSNNYAKGGGQVDGSLVTLNKHLVSTWDLTDLMAGKTPAKVWEAMAREAAAGLARGVFQYVIGLIVAGTYGNTTNEHKLVVAPASFDLDDLADLDALLSKKNALGPRTAIMTVDYATALKKDNQIQDASAFGSDSVIRTGKFNVPMYNISAYETNAFPTALTNEYTGVVLAVPQAIALAMRPVSPQEQNTTRYAVISDSDTGISMGYREFYQDATGTLNGCFEVLLGATAVQTTGAVRVVSQ